MHKCQLTIIKKLDSVCRIKLFCSLHGASVAACRNIPKYVKNGKTFVANCPWKTMKILGCGFRIKILSQLGGASVSLSVRYAT
jgi:hypothetical protein